MPTVLLVRHGRTTANATGVLAGWLPQVELDDTGRDQAIGVGRRLRELGAPPVRLVSSPITRCLQTAGLLMSEAQVDLAVETEPGLAECRYGAWTGRSLRELRDEPLWRTVQDHPSAARFPDGEDYPGESLAQMAARAVAAVRAMDASVSDAHGPGAVWVAVSHGDVIKAILADALGLHLDGFQRLVVDPASISVVQYTPNRPFVVRVNDIGGPLAGITPAAPDGDAPVGGGSGAG